LALGAEPGRVLAEVVRAGMLPVGVGVVAGAAVAFFASRAVAGFLFEVTPTDPLSLVAAGGALLLAGLAAAVVPAWRAGMTLPAEALRSD
jgi:ABC-type lipoprotein release transport system permease subunit